MIDYLRKLIHRPKPEVSEDDIVRAEITLEILARDVLQVAQDETATAPSGATLTTFLSEEHRNVGHDELFVNLERLAPEHGLRAVDHSDISYTFKKI